MTSPGPCKASGNRGAKNLSEGTLFPMLGNWPKPKLSPTEAQHTAGGGCSELLLEQGRKRGGEGKRVVDGGEGRGVCGWGGSERNGFGRCLAQACFLSIF